MPPVKNHPFRRPGMLRTSHHGPHKRMYGKAPMIYFRAGWGAQEVKRCHPGGDNMNKKTIAILAPIAVLVTLAVAFADDSNKNHLTPYKLLTTIPIPGGLTGFDISWVDSGASRYYLA